MQAVLILAHKDVKSVIELSKKLQPCFEIYIHFDTKLLLSEEEKQEMERNQFHFFRRIEVNWGAWGISAAAIVLMREALKDPRITHMHVISGQDWPAKKAEDIYSFYEGNRNIYMTCDPARGVKKSGEPIILWQQYFFNYDKVKRRTTYGKIYHRVSMAIQTLLRVNKYKKLNIEMEICQGANWMDLPRDAVEYLLDYFDTHENVQKLFMTGFCPDEFWVQTILNNSELSDRIIRDYHRYVKWERQHDSYPAILDERDFDEIVKGEYHFLRKVDDRYSLRLKQKLEEYQMRDDSSSTGGK